MPKPLQPDTSPQNVAEILRRLADVANPCDDATCSHVYCGHGRTARALADALERQAEVTWEERVKRVMDDRPFPEGVIRATMAIAFPEYAPTESESDD